MHCGAGVSRAHGAGRRGSAHLHLLGGQAGHAALQEQQAEAAGALAAGAHGDGEEVAEDAVGDPLLLAVDDVELAGRVLHRRGAQARHVAARVRLRDGQADELLALQAVLHALVLQVLAADAALSIAVLVVPLVITTSPVIVAFVAVNAPSGVTLNGAEANVAFPK